ncbi:MAG TPA: hypothetical protein VM616_09755 [Gammaproteobacteria bacterium]|nr:hypothetical protein [Gammaproteobacteria bacterium]
MVTTREETVIAEADPAPLLSWGAVLAGLAFVIAASWLLFLLGSAVGVSVADAADLAAIGDGLGTGVVVWMLLSSLIVFFIGSLLTARLANRSEAAAGMLHGVVLWSVGTALMLLLGTWGVQGMIKAGGSAIQTVVSAGASVGAAVGGADAPGAERLAESPLMSSVGARIKREIAGALAGAQRPAPAAQTAPQSAQPAPGAAAPAASEQELRQAIDQIDADTLLAVAEPLIAGEPERARDVLAVNTTLTEQQVDAVIDGVSREFGQQIEEARQEMEATMEKVSTYTQAATWIAFVAAALGLAVSIGGGWLGASTVERLYAVGVSRRASL